MNVRIHKLLSLILAIAMVVGMLPAALAVEGTDSNDPAIVAEPAPVAKVGEIEYTDLQAAIVAAAPAGMVTLLNDVTVDKWVMITQSLTISSDQLITLESINGLTIDGAGHALTVKSIESATNGNHLFYDATELNIKNLTINYVDAAAKQGGIGLTSGTIENVTINGGVGVYPGTGEITIDGCTFNTAGSAIYNETDRDNLTVTDCTFNTAAGQYAIYLRGKTTFTGNTVKTGKVNVTNSATGTISGNDFGTERFKVYNGATATISNNTINNLVFNDATAPTQATFTNNTLSEDAQTVLNAVTPKNYVAQIGETKYTDLHEAMVACKAGETVLLVNDVNLAGTEWEPVSFKGAFDGQGHTISNLTINKPGVSNTGFITSLNGTFKNVTFANPTVTGGENTGVVAGRAGGSAALAENITVNGTIKVETTHSGYARAAAIVGGWAYGNYKDITVDGGDKADSYIKHTGGGDGRYVAGIVGHADDVKSYVNCTVKNITISGGWLCGGIAGPGPADGQATGCAVEDIDMGADYSGGMFGWYYGSGTIENSIVKDVAFTDGTTNNGAIGGYGANDSANVVNVTIENVTNGGAALLEHVAEINGTYYFNLQAALDAAQSDDTVTLLSDVTITETLVIANGKAVTLDLNGNDITNEIPETASVFHTIKNSGALTVTDSASGGELKSNANKGYVIYTEIGSLVVDGAKIVGINNGYAIVTWTGGDTITIKNGTVVEGRGALYIDGGATGTVNGGTFTMTVQTTNNQDNVVYVGGTSELTINDGTFSTGGITGDQRIAVAALGTSKVTINGGTFYGLTGDIQSRTSAGNVSITGGTFTGTKMDERTTDSIAIVGGTFSYDPTEWCAEGFEPVANGDGTYDVKVTLPEVAQIGETKYETLEEALKAAQDGDTIQLMPGVTIEEGSIKLPSPLKNVTIKGAEGAVLKDMTISHSDGGTYEVTGLTIDGVVFDNSNIVLTGWRTGYESMTDFTVTNCVFKNIVRSESNLAAVHINVAANNAVENFTFTNNVIDGVTGAQNSGIYGQFTGNVTIENNTINNVAFRPYVIQITTDDGNVDNFTVTGNTFSGSAAGRAQGLGNNAEGTDTVNLTVTGNIFKGITSAQQICYWAFNPETTTADLSKNYYDIDILANPNRIYYNSAAKNAADLIDMGVYPYYSDEAMTELVEAPSIMVTYPVGNPVYPEGKVEYYDDMLEAVPYTTNCPRLEGATITLLRSIEASGIRMMENGMVLDLNTHTYTIIAGTGSQGTNTSGFQIRPEVTTSATIKNGTIKVAEGAPVVWMFNCYATDFVVEDVTVDCTNMAYSYGESCYVVVSRAEDNVQLTGTTEIVGFDAEKAGNAINVGGTMTIADTVQLNGAVIELDAGAVLTAPAGLIVNAPEGCKVVYADGKYTAVAVTYVAQIGETKYETFEKAIAAAVADASVTRIEILADCEQIAIENPGETYALLAGQNLTIGAAEPYTISLSRTAGETFSIYLMNGNSSLTIEENVTIEGLDIVANGFATASDNLTIDGDIKAVSLKQWTNNGTITVNEDGSVWLGYGDGQFDMAYGNGTVTINGSGDKTTAQFKAGYSGTRGNGNTLNLKDTYFEGGAWFNVNGSNGTFNVENSLLKVSGGDAAGSMTVASSGNQINLTNGSVLSVANLTLGAGNTVTLGAGSSIETTKISGAGTITIDATGMEEGEVATITGDATGFTGTVEVINNPGLEAKIVDGKIVLEKKVTEVDTLTELKEALNIGGEILVTENIVIDEEIVIPANAAVTVDEDKELRIATVVYTFEEREDYAVKKTRNGVLTGTVSGTVKYVISLDDGATWIDDTYNGGAQAVTVKTDGTVAVSSSFQSAFTSAKTGEVVHMLKNVHVQSTNPKKNNGPLRSYYGLILEGNGHTIFTDLESSGASNEYATIKFTSYLAGTGPVVNPVLKNVTIDSQKNAKADLDYVSGDVTFTVTMYNVNLLGNCQYASFAMTSPSLIVNKSNVEIYDCSIPSWDAGSANAINLYSGEYSLSLNSKCTVYGGTYTKDPTNYLAEGMIATKGEDGKFGVYGPYVAKIGETYYATLQAALDAAAAGTGNVTVEILSNVNLTGVDWNPVTVSAPGYPVVTVNGNNKIITGLNDMLFAGTWAGGSGLIINDLTIKDSAIVNDKDDSAGNVGVGAFIGYPQASATITLDNCHLVDSSVEGGHWTGGLIGMAGGYNGNDGPVFMNLTITGCSVTGSTITGKGSAGGVIGHGSCADWTNVVIENTTVSGNTITSTGSSTNKAGAVMGTIGAAGQEATAAGETKTGGAFVAATVSGNTVTSKGTVITTIYGRQGTPTGTLEITGGTYDANPIEEGVSYAYPKEGYVIKENTDGTYGIVVDPTYGKVAKIGETYYTSLQAALDAAQNNETVILLKDINIADVTPVTLGGKYNTLFRVDGETITMNLAGKKISGTYSGNSMLVGVFSAEDNGHLTITGEGTVDIKAEGTVYGLLVAYDETSSLTVKNGTWTLDKASDSLAYTGGNENMFIEGGTFTLGNVGTGTNGSPWIFNAGGQNTAHVIVSGGTFNADVAHQYYPFEVEIADHKGLKNNNDGTWTVVDANFTVTEYEWSGAWYGNKVSYETLEEAFAAAESAKGDGSGAGKANKPADVVTIYEAGTYALSTAGKDITITGGVDGVVFDNIGAKNMGGANVTFNNVTFDYYPNVDYTGLQHSGNLVYNNCTFNGQVFLYGVSETFNKCTFNQNSAGAYNVWTYGADKVEFNECTFNCVGKSVLVYNEGDGATELNVFDTDFIASAPADGKAAIEIDTTRMPDGTKIVIDAQTTATGFAAGSISGSSLWNDKKDQTDLTVTVDGVKVWPPVAKIGETETKYASLTAAIEAAKANETITLLADVNEDVTVNKNLTIDGAEKNYTGTMTVNTSLTVTVQNVNFVKGSISEAKGTHGYLTVKNCDFDGVDKSIGYAISVRGADKVTIENSTAENYSYGMLYIPSSVANVSVKDVTVENVTAAFNISYSGNGTFENVTVANATYGLHVQNYGSRTFTMIGCEFNCTSPVYVQEKGTATVTFAFEGENKFTAASVDLGTADYAKLVLKKQNAVLTAPAGLNVTTTVADSVVVYENGTYQVGKVVAMIGETEYASFEAALNAVQNGETITLLGGESTAELSKEIEFTKAISFTITGTAPKYALPVVTFQNAVVTIKDAEILIPELDARQNATINVVDSIVHGAGNNGIVKSYYNGAINISGTSKVYTMQVTTMGYITVSDTAKLNATWQTNVYGNGLITVKDGATLQTSALNLTGKDYSGRDNTDADRVGKPAEIIVDNATLIAGKAYSESGADYSYETDKYGLNIGTIEGKSAVLNVKNGGKVEIYVGNGKTMNIGAGGAVNVDASTFTTACRAENGTYTLANNGTVCVSGASDVAADKVTGDGWFYMNGVTLDADTKLVGAKVAFINGENTVTGSTIKDGFFSVGIGQNAAAEAAAAFAAANGITLGDVTVNVSGNAVIGGNGDTYSGWVGSAYSADKTQHKYVLNVEESLAAFGYLHVSKDGTLNVKGHSTNKYTNDNANVDFYAGELIVNGVVTLDGTDAWAKFAKMSVDHADGVLNIVNGTNFEASIHNGSNTSTSLKFWKAGKITVDAASKVEIDNGTVLVEGAELAIAGNVTAKGAVTGAGTITLTDKAAAFTAPADLPVKSGVLLYKVAYEEGTYKLVKNESIVATIGDNQEFESVSAALNAADNSTTDKTVKLVKDATEYVIDVPSKVTLDLNGNVLTATFVYSTGDVIDTGDELGGLKFTRHAAVDPTNSYLPLYDKADDCYRFFAYKVRTGNPALNGNKVTFAFQIALTDAKFAETGYKLLAENPEAVTLYAELAYGDNTIDYKFKSENIAEHAKDWLNHSNTAPVVTLVVSGLDTIAGQTLGVAPILVGALGNMKTGPATSVVAPAQ